jgi:nucleoside-diphosphate-sugar epimerase
MNIAIVGCTSQIAQDFILNESRSHVNRLYLFGRDTGRMQAWLVQNALSDRHSVHTYDEFPAFSFDAILNFVGVGDPSRAAEMGASIFDITLQYDNMVLNALRLNPACRYIFLSSGAAYGSAFLKPVDEHSTAHIALNHFTPQEYYSVAKLHAECRHRAMPETPIVDLRVFNYFSRTQNIQARFLITDIVRAIVTDTELQTSADFMVRDFLHPTDFHQLITCILNSPPSNLALDCYSSKPISKQDLLNTMVSRFGLRFSMVEQPKLSVNATGTKPHYYSLNHKAAELGYAPKFSSLDTVLSETEAILESIRG